MLRGQEAPNIKNLRAQGCLGRGGGLGGGFLAKVFMFVPDNAVNGEIVLLFRPFSRLQNALKNSVFEASKSVSITKALLPPSR